MSRARARNRRGVTAFGMRGVTEAEVTFARAPTNKQEIISAMRVYHFRKLRTGSRKLFIVTVAMTFLIAVLVVGRGILDTEPGQASLARLKPYQPISLYVGHHSRLPIPSVILRPIPPPPSGLGDQLYRFAFAYAAARDLDTTLYVVLRPHELVGREFSLNDRHFVLDNFRLESPRVKYMMEATFDAIPEDRKFLLDEFGPWRPHELPRDKIVVVTEYWQSDMYFGRYKKELMAQYVPRDSVLEKPRLTDLVSEIRRSESVAVHVRRGDFQSSWHGDETSSPWHRVLDISYQLRAMELVRYLLATRREPDAGPRASWRRLTFFVFSDDIEFTRRQMEDTEMDAKLVFVSTPDKKLSSIEEFELMCLCRHQIIPNSGFSWWAAWLNPNQATIIVAPFPRHRYRFYPPYGPDQPHKEDLYWNHSYPPTWLTLNPYTGYADMM